MLLQARGSLRRGQEAAMAHFFLGTPVKHWLLCPSGVRLRWGFAVPMTSRLLTEKAI